MKYLGAVALAVTTTTAILLFLEVVKTFMLIGLNSLFFDILAVSLSTLNTVNEAASGWSG